MPYNNYRRKTYRKRYNRKRYRRYRKPYSKPVRYKVADMAYSGYKMGLKAMKYLNTEHKHFDSEDLNIPVDANGGLRTLNLVPQGDTDQSRDGDSLKMLTLTMRGIILNASVGNSTTRVIVFMDKMNQISTVSDLLEAIYLGGNNATNAPKNYDNRFRSKIIWDRSFTTSPNGKTEYNYHDTIELNTHVQYNNGTTTIQSGALKICVISNQIAAPPIISATYRLTFVDN